MLGLDRFLAWTVWRAWSEPVGWLDRLESGFEALGWHGAEQLVQALASWLVRHLGDPLSTLERRLCSWAEVPGRHLD